MVKRLAALASVLAACGQPHTFTCATDAECGLAGRCEANAFCSFPDEQCASGSRYGEHAPADVRDTCVAQPSNAACEAAGELVTGGATTGDLRGAGRSVVLACSPQVTTEAFYALTLAECSDISLRAEAAGGNVGVALLDDCATELGCRDANQTNAAEVLELDGVAAGTYQIAVGGVFYDGTFDVSTSIEPAPSNDVIGTELPVAPSIPTELALARANDDRTCGTRTGGRDLFYQLILAPTDASNGTLLWSVDATAVGTSSSDFAVELIAPNGSSLGCSSTAAAAAHWRDLVPGNYTLAVDGPTDGSCGHFSLAAVARQVQDNDTCATPRSMSVASTTVLPVERFGTLDDATDDSSSSICGGAGGDVVYRLHVADRTHLKISVTETGGGFTPVVYVRPDAACGAIAAEIPTRNLLSCDPAGAPSAADLALSTTPACAKGPVSGTATVELQQVDPGDYLVFVDSDDHGGDYKLSVERVSPKDELRAGTSLLGNCTVPDEFLNVTCCGLVSTVEAVREVISCANPHADVFRSVPIDPGCGITGAFEVFSETPHQVEMVLSGSCTGSGACGGPATLVNGLYTSSVSFTAQSSGGPCTASARVTSLDPFAQRGPVLVRYVQEGQPFCD